MKKLSSALMILLVNLLFMTAMTAEVDAKEELKNEIRDDIEQIIDWKKASFGLHAEQPLLSSQFLNHAGDASGDWYPFAIGRIGYPDDYRAYLAVVEDQVSKRYRKAHQLDESKATEWHRIALAILAVGGDPTNVGSDKNGEPINLIADGTYARAPDKPLDFQGINGLTWGLITLDSLGFKIPDDAGLTRDEIIMDILKQQLPDGGFSLNGTRTDPDITGMVIQALAPYYNSEKTYEYQLSRTNVQVAKTVRQVIDEALQALSNIQEDNGTFKSFGFENAESIVQVIVALTELGIDPTEDERFIKNGNNLIDALKSFQMEDGGFIHSKRYDPENPSADPNKSNSMASEQVLYAFVALYRFYEGARTLFDFRQEMDADLKEAIDAIKADIDALPSTINESHKTKVEQLFNRYKAIPVTERRYVFNYYKLADAMEQLNIENDSEYIADHMGEVDRGNGAVTPLFTDEFHRGPIIFTAEDAKKVENLPEDLTTEHYGEVVRLLDKLENAENRDEYEHLIDHLLNMKEKIGEIEQEIEALNKEIMDDLFPFEELSVEDRDKINGIIERYNRLSDYDQQKIVNYEDVERAKAEIDSKARKQIVATVLGILFVLFTIWFVVRRRKKRREKEMEFIDLED